MRDEEQPCSVIHFGSDSEEELCFPKEEEIEQHEESIRAEEECLMNLRQGKILLERQAPKEKEKGKEKEIEIKENEGPNDKPKFTQADYNIIAHLRKIPALLSVFDALMMSQELREVLVHALQNPEKYQSYFVVLNNT